MQSWTRQGLAVKELMISWGRHIMEHNNYNTMFTQVPAKRSVRLRNPSPRSAGKAGGVSRGISEVWLEGQTGLCLKEGRGAWPGLRPADIEAGGWNGPGVCRNQW